VLLFKEALPLSSQKEAIAIIFNETTNHGHVIVRNEDQKKNNPLASFASCPCPAGKGTDMSKLQVNHCITPEL